MSQENKNIDDLITVLTSLQDKTTMTNFIIDITTPQERKAIAERWKIARLLHEDKLTYREISAQTGASTTTVTRVARCLHHEPQGGYRKVLES